MESLDTQPGTEDNHLLEEDRVIRMAVVAVESLLDWQEVEGDLGQAVDNLQSLCEQTRAEGQENLVIATAVESLIYGGRSIQYEVLTSLILQLDPDLSRLTTLAETIIARELEKPVVEMTPDDEYTPGLTYAHVLATVSYNLLEGNTLEQQVGGESGEINREEALLNFLGFLEGLPPSFRDFAMGSRAVTASFFRHCTEQILEIAAAERKQFSIPIERIFELLYSYGYHDEVRLEILYTLFASGDEEVKAFLEHPQNQTRLEEIFCELQAKNVFRGDRSVTSSSETEGQLAKVLAISKLLPTDSVTATQKIFEFALEAQARNAEAIGYAEPGKTHMQRPLHRVWQGVEQESIDALAGLARQRLAGLEDTSKASLISEQIMLRILRVLRCSDSESEAASVLRWALSQASPATLAEIYRQYPEEIKWTGEENFAQEDYLLLTMILIAEKAPALMERKAWFETPESPLWLFMARKMGNHWNDIYSYLILENFYEVGGPGLAQFCEEALEVSPRAVLWYIGTGDLEGSQERSLLQRLPPLVVLKDEPNYQRLRKAGFWRELCFKRRELLGIARTALADENTLILFTDEWVVLTKRAPESLRNLILEFLEQTKNAKLAEKVYEMNMMGVLRGLGARDLPRWRKALEETTEGVGRELIGRVYLNALTRRRWPEGQKFEEMYLAVEERILPESLVSRVREILEKNKERHQIAAERIEALKQKQDTSD